MMLHETVLLQESVDALDIKPAGIYVDGTFGRGGHSKAILQRLGSQGKLLVIDKDKEAIVHAHNCFNQDPRVEIFHGSFSKIGEFTKKAGVYGGVDGILLDLGVSSPQLDDAERGFSFMKPGPLDMRMNQEDVMSAEQFVNNMDEDNMVEIFRNYGEERYAKRIAHAIVKCRLERPITTTQDLANIVKEANPRWEKNKHPATRVFQAIRIYINQELHDLEVFLTEAMSVLAVGGRLAIISFHSLEDRIVKQFMRVQEQGAPLPKGIPFRSIDYPKCFRRIGKAVKPSVLETEKNIRSRSAVLRIGEKLA
mgnify:CR=1 FL=1